MKKIDFVTFLVALPFGLIALVPRSGKAQSVVAASTTPFRNFLPDMCWAGLTGFAVQEVWQATADSLAVRLQGIPGLKPIEDGRPWGVSVSDSLRACAAQLSGTPPRGLRVLDAARVKLGLNDDAAAWALTEQYLRETGTHAPRGHFVADRGWALMLAASDQVMAIPPRWATAERLVGELDHLQEAPLPARVFAHVWMAATADWEHDDNKLLREVDVINALWSSHKREMEENVEAVLQGLIGWRVGMLIRQQHLTAARMVFDSGYTVLAATGHAGQLGWLGTFLNTLNKPASPIRGTWWYNTPDSGHMVRPAHGKVTLVIKTDPYPLVSQVQYERLRVLQALQRKYGSRGLEIVTVDETVGVFYDSLFVNPGEEGERRRRFFLEEHQLPGILTIYRNTDWHQLPDGRWRSKPSPRDISYPTGLTLVDQQGNIVNGMSNYERFGAYLDARIGQLLTH